MVGFSRCGLPKSAAGFEIAVHVRFWLFLAQNGHCDRTNAKEYDQAKQAVKIGRAWIPFFMYEGLEYEVTHIIGLVGRSNRRRKRAGKAGRSADQRGTNAVAPSHASRGNRNWLRRYR